MPARTLTAALLLTWTFLAAASLVSAQSPRTAPAAVDRDVWHVIELGGQRIGHARIETRSVPGGDGPTLRTIVDQRLRFKRFGEPLRMHLEQSFDQAADGALLSFVHAESDKADDGTRTVGRVVEDQGTARLEIESTVAGQRRSTSRPWDRAVRPVYHRQRLIADPPMQPGDVRSFTTYLPELDRITRVRIAADVHRGTKMHDGNLRKLLLLRVTYPELPTLPDERYYVDEQGSILKIEADMLGRTMTTWAVPAEEALKEIPEIELDLAVQTLVKTNPIPRAHETGRVVYRITMENDDPAKYLASGGTQSIRRLGPHAIELTVTAVSIPQGRRQAKVDREYLADTRFLQTSDFRVRDHARQASAGEFHPSRIALRMEQHVYEVVKEKNFSTALATAAEVAEGREGDCTEHAVLLAAMLRVKNIPSRIVAGLIYLPGRDAFAGHMWTEALLDGRWVPLDAMLGQGGIGAAHIKLGDSSFADNAPAPVTTFLPILKLLGNVKIEVITAGS